MVIEHIKGSIEWYQKHENGCGQFSILIFGTYEFIMFEKRTSVGRFSSKSHSIWFCEQTIFENWEKNRVRIKRVLKILCLFRWLTVLVSGVPWWMPSKLLASDQKSLPEESKQKVCFNLHYQIRYEIISISISNSHEQKWYSSITNTTHNYWAI